MKTKLNLKNFFKYCLIILTMSFFACKDNEDPDPRQAFLGTFEMDDLEVRVLTSDGTDSTIMISNNSEIEFEMDSDLDADELKIEFEEFLDDIIRASIQHFLPSVQVNVDLDDDSIVEVSNDKFDLDDLDFNTTFSDSSSTDTYPCEVEGEGELSGNEISFEFEIIIYVETSTITLQGTIEGEKD